MEKIKSEELKPVTPSPASPGLTVALLAMFLILWFVFLILFWPEQPVPLWVPVP
ncbi:MAG: hypothetical protein Q7S19_00950 [bacterium]|nr:hypothetical protein [bacterium]